VTLGGRGLGTGTDEGAGGGIATDDGAAGGTAYDDGGGIGTDAEGARGGADGAVGTNDVAIGRPGACASSSDSIVRSASSTPPMSASSCRARSAPESSGALRFGVCVMIAASAGVGVGVASSASASAFLFTGRSGDTIAASAGVRSGGGTARTIDAK
jgi:hypothetical protein